MSRLDRGAAGHCAPFPYFFLKKILYKSCIKTNYFLIIKLLKSETVFFMLIITATSSDNCELTLDGIHDSESLWG